jgi:DNA invertase Pin-like site-specific DNA recombinase
MDADPQSTSHPGAIVPVAIYTRVSTDNQVGGRFDSCESQLAICRDHIRKNSGQGWVEMGHFSDPAFSGSTMNRPGLRALMRQVETGGVKVILIFKLERMSRNIDEWGPFRNFLKQHGCRLESATEDISENTPSGRLKNNLMLSFSQYEKENTAEKTQAKMEQQAKRGYWNGGAVPFGYAYDKNTQTLQPHPEEAPIVRRVFELAAQLVTLEQIADVLNREGLRTRARLFRRTDGTEHMVGVKRFRSDGLRLMITNPIYRGVIRYAGHEHAGRHERLVTDDLWEKTNAVVVKTVRPVQTLKPDQDKHFHLLKGLVHCGCCNRALVPHASGNRDESGRLYRYYYCSHLVKERADSRCTVRRISAGSLESAVVQFLSELGRHPDVIGAAVGSSQTRRLARQVEVKRELGRLERELSSTNSSIRNCVESIAAGGKAIAEELAGQVTVLKDRKQELTVQRERLSQELAGCESEILDEHRVSHAVEQFGQILQGLTPDEQKTLVALFVDRVVVRPSKDDEGTSFAVAVRRLELEFKLNLPRLVEGMEERVMEQGEGKRLVMRGFVVTAQVALGQQGRANQAIILTPFRCGEEPQPQSTAETPAQAAQKAQNPLLRARAWKRMLAQDPKLSLRRLAAREGLVAPTLVQHFKLLKLAPDIQSQIAGMRNPDALRFFSLRRLMPLAELSVAEQRRFFREWQAVFGCGPGLTSQGASVATVPANGQTRGIRPF